MRVELLHHYGWEAYEIPAAQTLEDAAYLAVRESHKFLTDANHTYDAKDRGGFASVRVYRGPGAPAYSGPKWAETDYWFATRYRAPSNTCSAATPQPKSAAYDPALPQP